MLLANSLGGGEKRPCFWCCLLSISTHHHCNFLSNLVAGDSSLGKVSPSRIFLSSLIQYRSLRLVSDNTFSDYILCFAVFLELCCLFWAFMEYYGGRLRKQKWWWWMLNLKLKKEEWRKCKVKRIQSWKELAAKSDWRKKQEFLFQNLIVLSKFL